MYRDFTIVILFYKPIDIVASKICANLKRVRRFTLALRRIGIGIFICSVVFNSDVQALSFYDNDNGDWKDVLNWLQPRRDIGLWIDPVL